MLLRVKKSLRTLMFFLVFIGLGVDAKDLGVYGEVYPIKEMDFLEFINLRLHHLEQTGGLKKMQENLVTKARQRADRPPPVVGVTRTVQARRWQFNPTFIVERDLTDHEGHILAHAGEQYNPLQLIPWRHVWLFYDADDQEQVAWAQQEDRKLQGYDKLILVNGSIAAQMKLFHKRIYFDQYGKITARLGITQVPARVQQRGMFLEISEIRL